MIGAERADLIKTGISDDDGEWKKGFESGVSNNPSFQY